MAWVSLCDLNELVEDHGKFVEIDGYQLAVFLHAGKVHAMDNECPHAGGPLWEGTIEAGYCICPWHAWHFCLETGALKDAPRVTISTYPIRMLERDGKPTLVQADLPMP